VKQGVSAYGDTPVFLGSPSSTTHKPALTCIGREIELGAVWNPQSENSYPMPVEHLRCITR
jgi:hypothetical protein